MVPQHGPFSLHTMLKGPWLPKMAFPTRMVRPLDESQGSSPLQGHGSWLMCEVALSRVGKAVGILPSPTWERLWEIHWDQSLLKIAFETERDSSMLGLYVRELGIFLVKGDNSIENLTYTTRGTLTWAPWHKTNFCVEVNKDEYCWMIFFHTREL